MRELEIKRIPMMDLIEGWESKRLGRDKAVFFHVGSGVKFNVSIENGNFVVKSNTVNEKEVNLEDESELKKFLFKMMCLIDNYTI